MTDKIKQPYINLDTGLAIFKVQQSKQWRVYIKLDGHKPLRFSLKTSVESEARKLAYKEFWFTEEKIKRGELISPPKSRLTTHQVIDKLIEEYSKLQAKINEEEIRQAEIKGEFKTKKTRVGNETHSSKIRHWKRIKEFYSEKMRPSQLSADEIRDYFYNLETLSETQFKIIKFCFKSIFERSIELKLINYNQAVDFKNIKVNTKSMKTRDALTKDQFNQMWIYSLTSFKTSGKGVHHNKMCAMAAGFIYHTGIRIGEELLGIHWSHIKETTDKHLYCEIKKGKTENYTTKNRKVLIDTLALGFLVTIARLKHPELVKDLDDNQAMMYLSKIKSNEQIFATNYSMNPDYRTTFNKWVKDLKDNGILPKNKNYVLYSLRHSYITNALEDNIPLHVVSDTVGTSLKMIQEHYKHTSVMNQSSIEYLMKTKLMQEEMTKPILREKTPEELQKAKI
uniref:tyrosine-type recombinase/integrase n=1 Tax=Psychromonas sp. TaxID=1884585 RepID=UPI003A981B21